MADCSPTRRQNNSGANSQAGLPECSQTLSARTLVHKPILHHRGCW
jgi:hypothetical protein